MTDKIIPRPLALRALKLMMRERGFIDGNGNVDEAAIVEAEDKMAKPAKATKGKA